MGKNTFSLLTIILFGFLATFPLLHEGFPPSHDGEYHIIRFYEFFKTLWSGVFYPRWAEDLNNGYGVPLFNYVYPLPNYIASIFHLIGFSFIDSFKYSLILATYIGAAGFYFFAKYFTSRLGAVVGAIIYIFTPYRFVDMYVRGSVGEVWALAIIPLLLWSLTILIKEGKHIYIGVTSVLLALLVFSHNILALLFSPFLLTFAGFLILQTKNKVHSGCFVLVALILGLGTSAIFWLPALLEKKYVRGLEVYDYKTNFPDLSSLLFPSWGTGFAGNVTSGMSTQIGAVNLLIVLLSLVFTFVFFKKKNYLFLFTLTWLFLSILLMLPLSNSVWEIIPLFRFVQFPWRYLSLVILLCSFLAAQLISVVHLKVFFSIGLVSLAVITTINYTKPAYYHNRDDNHYISRDNFIHGTNSPGNAFNTLWINKPLPKNRERIEVFSGHGTITQAKFTPELYTFTINARSPVSLVVNTAFFPGWEAQVSGKRVVLQKTEKGLMKFSLPGGNHFVTVKFADTIVRRAGVLASFFSLTILGVLTGFLIFRHKKDENRD